MKKIILFLVISFLYGFGYSAPLFEENFESQTTFDLWSQVQLGTAANWSHSGTYADIQSFSGNKTAFISPAIAIPDDADKYNLKFWARAQDNDFLSAEVFVSTTGIGDAATFDAKYTVIKTFDENSADVSYGNWVKITDISLDAYKGQSINIAFVHTGNNSRFAIDSVTIERIEAPQGIAWADSIGNFESQAVFDMWSQVQLGSAASWNHSGTYADIQSFSGNKTAFISPTIAIPNDAGNYNLKFWARAQDNDFLSAEVFVSTTGIGDAATFDAKYTVIKTFDENGADVSYGNWVKITDISLDAYKGQSINIAFVHTGNNSRFAIDSVKIDKVEAPTGITWADSIGNFENQAVFDMWSQIQVSGDKLWGLQEFQNPNPSGSNNVKIQSFSGDKTAFISPMITIPNNADSNYTLRFWSKVQDNDFLSAEVFVSTTGIGDAATFTEKFTTIKTFDEASSDVQPYNTWIEITGISLNDYKGQSINIAFAHTGNNSGWWIDAITIKHVDPVTPKYTVNITTPTNGTITVMNGETEVTSGDEIEEGTILTLTALQASDYKFTKWWNNTLKHSFTYTVNGNVTISATFDKLTNITELPYNVNFLTNTDLNNFATISEGNNDVNTNLALGAWVIADHSSATGQKVVQSPMGAGPNFNALITSAIVIPETGSFEFAFNTSFGQVTTYLYDSTCRVMISKTVSNDLSAFTEVFDMYSDRDGLGTNTYREFTIPLADYAGDTIYIAFVKQSKEGSTTSQTIVWRIDNLSVRELYTATITEPENGTITVMNGSTPVNSGDEVGIGTTLTLTATPANDYKFEAWWDGNTNAYRTFTTTGSHTIEATFTKVDYISTLPYSIDFATSENLETEFAKFPTMSRNASSAWKVDETSIGAEPEATVNVLVSDPVSGPATEAFITPGIVVPEIGVFELSFATSYYYDTNNVGTFPSDSCLVRISTTVSNDLSAFTTKAFNLSSDRISGEDTLKIDNIGKFRISLSDYAGDTIYIAFVKKTTEQSLARGIEWRIHEFEIIKELHAITITQSENGTIIVKNGEETVNSGDIIEAGTELTLTATPDENYEFTEWWDENTQTPRSYTVTTAVEISATFAKHTYTVTITEPENGTITVKNGEETVNSGDKIEVGTELTLTASPANEYEFINWWDNDTNAVRNYTVTDDVTISAIFDRLGVNIEDANLASKVLAIYPNPVVNDKLTVELPKNSGVVHIFDLSGKLVLTLTANSPKIEINISNLPNGSYVVKVGAASAKFIKH